MFSQTPYFIAVKEQEGTLCYTRDDLIGYAGHGALIASALTMRLLSQAFLDLSPNTPPQRDKIFVVSAFPGLGVRDCIELVTRAYSNGRYTVDTEKLPADAPSSPIGGGMYFEIYNDHKGFAYTFNPTIFDQRWFDAVLQYQKGAETAEEHAKYVAYKYKIVAQLLTQENVFLNIKEITKTQFLYQL